MSRSSLRRTRPAIALTVALAVAAQQTPAVAQPVEPGPVDVQQLMGTEVVVAGVRMPFPTALASLAGVFAALGGISFVIIQAIANSVEGKNGGSSGGGQGGAVVTVTKNPVVANATAIVSTTTTKTVAATTVTETATETVTVTPTVTETVTSAPANPNPGQEPGEAPSTTTNAPSEPSPAPAAH